MLIKKFNDYEVNEIFGLFSEKDDNSSDYTKKDFRMQNRKSK